MNEKQKRRDLERRYMEAQREKAKNYGGINTKKGGGINTKKGGKEK
jgi:hypothetical protein